MKLSPHFNLAEFTRSQTAARQGRPIVVDEGSPVFNQIRYLCNEVLEPIRELLGCPVQISSGFRPDWLNRLVGGSPNSQHLHGLAADIVVPGYTPMEVCRLIRDSKVPFDQLILEFDEWTHVSAAVPGKRPRREMLTARSEGGRTSYLKGLVAAPPPTPWPRRA